MKSAKNNVTDTLGTEHSPSHVCGLRVSAVPLELIETICKYTDLTPKLLSNAEHRHSRNDGRGVDIDSNVTEKNV